MHPSRFDFRGKAVRTVEREGEPWFVVVDICAALELRNPRSSVAILDEDEKYTVHSMDGITRDDRAQEITIVNESGLYSLILRSRKPEAKEFKRWITHEVLPAIRKYGFYDPKRIEANALLSKTFSPRKPAGEISGKTGLPKVLPIRGHFRSTTNTSVRINPRMFTPDLFEFVNEVNEKALEAHG